MLVLDCRNPLSKSYSIFILSSLLLVSSGTAFQLWDEVPTFICSYLGETLVFSYHSMGTLHSNYKNVYVNPLSSIVSKGLECVVPLGSGMHVFKAAHLHVFLSHYTL